MGAFYGLLASMRGQLFEDEEFAELYCADNGRDSVAAESCCRPPLLLQTHDRVSDAEAKQRADFDIRWKVALGIEVEDRPFAKSTLQLFRARLILHEKVREVFRSAACGFARETGYLKSRRMKVALDTTYILGRGGGEGHLQPSVGRDSQNWCVRCRRWAGAIWMSGRQPGDTRDMSAPA